MFYLITTKDIILLDSKLIMQERTMPICFTTDQYKLIETIAKRKKMLNASQLIEEALENI